MNYARWQLLHNEYNNVGAAALSYDEVKKVHKTGFPVAETVSQACAQAVEKIMLFAVARPFVEEFVTAKVVDQVNRSKFYFLYICVSVLTTCSFDSKDTLLYLRLMKQ